MLHIPSVFLEKKVDASPIFILLGCSFSKLKSMNKDNCINLKSWSKIVRFILTEYFKNSLFMFPSNLLFTL